MIILEIIIAVLVVFIAYLMHQNKLNRENEQNSRVQQEELNEINHINFLLIEIDEWEANKTIDAETALLLKKRYRKRKEKLLGIKPQHKKEIIPVALEEEESLALNQVLPDETPVIKENSKSINSKPAFNLMNFLREKNIKWFNALGTLMLLASGIIFVITNWDAWNGGVKSIIMVIVTIFFFLGGYFIKNKLELPNSGLAFFLVGSLFVPLNMVAFNNFAVFGRSFNWNGYLTLTAVLSMFFYAFMTYKMNSQIFTGLTAFAGTAGLFELLSYLQISYSAAGKFFMLLSLFYFLVYFLICRSWPNYKKLSLPLAIGANVVAAFGLGLAAIDKLSLSLLTAAVIGSVIYLISCYLFKRLEYLYVFVGTMVLAVFPGVGYYQLPGRSYNLSFITIAGIALFMSYLNRRINNKQFERNFFYCMMAISALAGLFAFSSQLQLFETPLKHNSELAGAMLTMLGGAVIYLLSAYLYRRQRFVYVGITSFAAGYIMGLMWLGISGKLYGLFFLIMSLALLLISRLFKNNTLWNQPTYITGIIANGFVTLLLTMLMATYPQIFAKYDTNLLAGIIAFVFNAAIYLYLAFLSGRKIYSSVGCAVFTLAYTMNAVYMGLTKWQFGLYFTGLTFLFLIASSFIKDREYFRITFKYSGIITNFFTVAYNLFLFYFVIVVNFAGNELQDVFRKETLFDKYNHNMVYVMVTYLVVTAIFIYMAKVFRAKHFIYSGVSVDYINFLLFYNWLGMPKTYIGSLLMLAVIFYLILSRINKLKEFFERSLDISVIGANVITTGLIMLLAAEANNLQYTILTLALLANAGVYLYFAFRWKSQVFTWASFVPLAFADIKFIKWFNIDPSMHYVGLRIILFALVLIGAGLIVKRKKYNFYYLPMFIAGYALSAIAVASGFIYAENLIYPAFLALVLYVVTTYFVPLYKEWFWRAALVAANISFGALIYKINPDYTIVTYVKYFVVFNLLKFALGFYFQYFEEKMDFAWSNYGGVIISSLLSLAITFISGNYQAAALVWLVYGLVYFILAWLIKQQIATYVSSVVITVGVGFVLYYLDVEVNQVGLYLAGLSFLWIWLNVLLKKFDFYRVPLFIIVPVSIAIPFINNLSAGYNSGIIGSLLATSALFAQGILQNTNIYYFIAPIALISGYETFLIKYNITFQELYLAPVSLYLIVVSFFWRSYNQMLNYLSYLGVLAFLGISFINSFEGENFLIHALILGIASVVSVILGAAMKHRGFFFIGIIFLLGDVITQSRSFLMSLQKWFWIGLGGTLFLTLGLLLDKKRKDRTLQLVNQQLEKFKTWS